MGRRRKPTTDIIKDNTVLIELTNGGYTTVDLEDYRLVKQYRWTKDGRGYAIGNKKDDTFVKLHRLLTSATDGQIIDHINRDKLDNRKTNLRIVTRSRNMLNGNIRVNNTSGFTGVSYFKRKNKWRAYIVINNKQKHLGYYIEKEQAINARKHAEKVSGL